MSNKNIGRDSPSTQVSSKETCASWLDNGVLIAIHLIQSTTCEALRGRTQPEVIAVVDIVIL